MKAPAAERDLRVSAGAAALGWLVVGVVGATSVFVRSDQGFDTAFRVAASGVAQACAAAALSWLALHLLAPRLPAKARISALFVCALGVAGVFVAPDLANFTAPVRMAGAALVALALAAAAGLGPRLDHTLARVGVGLVGLGLMGFTAVFDPGNHPGVHLLAMWFAAILVARALEAGPLPARGDTIAFAIAALVGATGWALPGAPSLRAESLRHPGLVFAPYVSRLHHRRAVAALDDTDLELLPESTRAWFVSREGLPARPPSAIPRPKNLVVVFITIDAVRPEVFLRDDAAERFPTLMRLQAEGVVFERAYTPAPSTVPAIASMFSGTYYSQRNWTVADFGRGREKFFLIEDELPRVPDLLREAGVAGFHVAPTRGLWARYGVTGDFGAEKRVKARGTRQVAALNEALESIGEGPALLYTHLLEPHAPYSGPQGATKFERYLGEIERVDALVAEVVATIEASPIHDRTIVLIGADHGEAFGEHAFFEHGLNIHEEVVRIPLFAWGAPLQARRIDYAVSLIDVAPTLLDLFGVATPGHMLGESLAPALFDANAPAPSRPVAIDSGRRSLGMIFPDGWKAMRDLHSGTAEVYDLNADPGERSNLVDTSEKARTHLELLDRFFEVHRGATPLDDVPYRP